MAAPGIRPRLVIADAQGNIYDDPELQMVCRKGYEFSLPKPDELIPLPEGSELFLDRKSTRLNSSHSRASRMPSSA